MSSTTLECFFKWMPPWDTKNKSKSANCPACSLTGQKEFLPFFCWIKAKLVCNLTMNFYGHFDKTYKKSWGHLYPKWEPFPEVGRIWAKLHTWLCGLIWPTQWPPNCMQLTLLERTHLQIKDGLMESLVDLNDIMETRYTKLGMWREVLIVFTFRIFLRLWGTKWCSILVIINLLKSRQLKLYVGANLPQPTLSLYLVASH